MVWHKADSVPCTFTNLLDISDEIYVITYRSLATLGKGIESAAKEKFNHVVAIAQDASLRAYYVFVVIDEEMSP